MTDLPKSSPFVRRIFDEYGLLALIIAAGLVIYGQRLLQPGIYWDDLDFLAQSRDLETFIAFLWVPHNEHLVPIWRFLTWAVYSAATAQNLSIAVNLVSIAGWAAVVILLDRVAAAQRVRPPFRQLGVALFAISSIYAESVAWYSGSQTMLALAAVLASMWLVMKRGRLRLALAAGGGFVAASIIATGALAVLILPIFAWRAKTRRPWVAPALVVTGVALYAVLYLTLIRDTVAQGPNAPAIDPAGLTVAARNFISSFFDVLILGSLGQIGAHPGVALWSKAIIAAALVGGLSYIAVRSKEHRKLIAVGLIMMVGAWALIYTFRSWVPYDASVLWGRYHVFPLAGLALAGGAALQWMFGERLPRRHLWNVAPVAGAAALLLLIHFTPGRAGVQRFWFPEQPSQFDQAAAVFDLANEFDLPRSWLLENVWLPVEMGEGVYRNASEFYPQPTVSNPRPEEFRAALGNLDFPVGPLAGWERGIELLGVSVPSSISQGSILPATLYWRSLTTVADDYTVFVHLRDADGRTCSQDDSFPAGNTSPTSTWQPGQQTRDRHDLLIDGDCTPGTYSVIVGLYTPADGRRLNLAGTSHSEIKVASVAVKF